MSETKNNLELRREAEERKLHLMAKVDYFFEMWQGSRNFSATQKEFHAENKQITPVEYISDSEEIMKAIWSNFQHISVAAFNLLGWLPMVSALFAQVLHGGEIQVLNIYCLRRIECDSAEHNEDGAPQGISDINNLLKWKCVFDDWNESEDDLEGDVESGIEQDTFIDNLISPERQNVSATSNVSGLIWPTERSKNQAEPRFMIVNAIESEGRKDTRKYRAESVHLFSPGSLYCLSKNFI